MIARRLQGTAAQRRRRRKTVAVASSIALHVGFVLLAVSSAPSSAFMGGAGAAGGAGDAVVVSLVGPIGGMQATKAAQNAKASASARLDAMMQKVHADQPDATPTQDSPRHDDLGQLFKEIAQSHAASKSPKNKDADKDTAKSKPGAGENGAQQQRSTAKGPQAKADAVEGEGDERGDKGRATGDMWDQIETCWRPDAAVPVTLEVVIDSGGRLAVPPRILRPDGARLDEPRLRAEARAVQAVASCTPFRSGAPLFGRKIYRFAFAGRR